MKSINFKITDEEKDALDAAAASEGLSLTAFFKARCLGESQAPGSYADRISGVIQRVQALEQEVANLKGKSKPSVPAPPPDSEKPPVGPQSAPTRAKKPPTADLTSMPLKTASEVRYYCQDRECDFSAISPKAPCPRHPRPLITAEKKESL